MKKNAIRTVESHVVRLVFSALFLAIGMVLPFLTGQIPQIGAMLCPLHIPVLLCGFVCGAPWGLAVGIILPLLRSAVFGMPPLMPIALAMAFELGAYGVAAGLLHTHLPRKVPYLYASLVGAMLVGRVVWGIASMILYACMGNAFSWQLFAAGAFVNALPGIALQLILIPPLVLVLQRIKRS